MNKSKIGIIVLSLLIVLALVFIFGNSLKNREDSGADSGVIAKLIEPVFNVVFGENHGIDVHHLVRKAAHFTEFCALGIIAFFMCRALGKAFKIKLFGFALFFVLAAAVTDEFIQMFSDRGSSVSDIVLDFCGAATGMLVCTLAIFIKSKIGKGRRN